MSEFLIESVVPESLHEHIDDKLREAHGRLAATSLKDIVKIYRTDQPLEFGDGEAGYVDIRPSADHDSKEAVVLPLPFANGWGPHMAIRAALLQNSLPQPSRMVVFPNNSSVLAHSFSKEDLLKIEKGNFYPMAEQQFRTLDKLGIENVHMVGYSQGASVGAATLDSNRKGHINILSASLIEAPNTLPRTLRQLKHDSQSVGLKPFIDAVRQSNIPALTEAQNMRGKRDMAALVTRLAIYWKNATRNPANRAQLKGFTHDRFATDIRHSQYHDGETVIHITNGANSLLMPNEAMEQVQATLKGVDTVAYHTVEGYGHEMGDNVIVHAILGRLAIQDANQLAF